MNENLIDSIRGLEGIDVGLFLDNNNTVDGTLFSVQKDHLILKINEDYFYFPFDRIKALSKNAKDTIETKGLPENSQINRVLLEEVLQTMILQWISVNSFNDRTFSGVLSKIATDYIVLVDGEKQYFIPKNQIMNLYNKQIDEDKIINPETNQPMNINFNPINEVPVNTMNSNPSGSNLQQNFVAGVPLSLQQKKELTELVRKKISRLIPSHTARTILQNRLSNAQQQNPIDDEKDDSATITSEEQITLENNSTKEAITNPPVNQSSQPQQQMEKNKSKLQSNVDTTTSPKKQSTKKQLEKSPFLQELRFDSPLETCTWSGIDSEKSKVNSQTEKKMEQPKEVVQLIEVKGDVTVDTTDEQTSTELVVVQQPIEEKKESQEEYIEAAEVLEDLNEDTVFENEPINVLIEDNKRLLEAQYYALMQFAKRMYHLENQYKTIMKHAEKMYLQLKERRYY